MRRCGAQQQVCNPPLVEFVRKLGSKNLPQTELTTLSAMAYEIARGVLEQSPIIQRKRHRNIHRPLETRLKQRAERQRVQYEAGLTVGRHRGHLT